MTQNLLEPLTTTLETVRHRLTQHQQVLSENKTRTRRSLIGDESIRVWSAHAKFSLLIGGEVERPQTPLNSLITPATRHSVITPSRNCSFPFNRTPWIDLTATLLKFSDSTLKTTVLIRRRHGGI